MDELKEQRTDRYSVEIDEDGYPVEEELYDEPQQEKPKKKSLLRKLLIRLIAVCAVVLLIELGILLYTGQIWFNEPRKKDYPVRGPIMDDGGGEIYWSKFPKQNIQMCYLRATKSTDSADKSFEKNWAASKGSGLPVGALHIFSLRASGKEQAENFLSAVGDLTGRLTPAVEVSPNIIEKIFSHGVNEVGNDLREFVDTVKQSCGVTPIIKCSSYAYDKYIRGEFSDCMIWYESLFSEPDGDVDWTFWEYTSRYRLESFDNSKKYLHMSVYRYSEKDFEKLIIKPKDT